MTYSQFVALYTDHVRYMSPTLRESLKLAARERFMIWFRGGPRQEFDDIAAQLREAIASA